MITGQSIQVGHDRIRRPWAEMSPKHRIETDRAFEDRAAEPFDNFVMDIHDDGECEAACFVIKELGHRFDAYAMPVGGGMFSV